ncbi:uncharacterized protein DUF3313 [Sphingomonas sp. PP-F2F-A104-K0414]|uniref:DUF3313 family protein n=1 Tax=Sphingomonas sp. PP-F2F-A104-K0414 TaxID=2135661 RepID=UPI0010E1A096|nr:DUF3313 family protein [Sphingomonas sp. PP-F2F-A104-K0414]TCP96376.1 uncharacterized protein DUF3313 [Sphingomonas sp. PP-F2F-A104-K0414]
MKRPQAPLTAFTSLCAAPLLLASCSTGGQMLTKSGFLPDYGKLQKPKRKNVAIWVSSGYQSEVYHQVIIDEPKWLAPHRDPKVEAAMREALRESLIATLSISHRVIPDVATAPAGTLRVRSAITGIRRTRWFLNAPLQVATFAAGGLGILAPLSGGASVEIVVDDAASRNSVLQMATYRNGQPWNIKGSYVAYDHARQAFEQSAKALAYFIKQPALATPSTLHSKSGSSGKYESRQN